MIQPWTGDDDNQLLEKLDAVITYKAKKLIDSFFAHTTNIKAFQICWDLFLVKKYV